MALAIDAFSTIEDRTIDITTTGRCSGEPQFTFHLKYGVVPDLPATATVIVDPAERRRVAAVFVEEFNRRQGPDSPWPEAVLGEWVEHSQLAKVTFAETD